MTSSAFMPVVRFECQRRAACHGSSSSLKTPNRTVWVPLSPVLCVVVGMSYYPFNKYCVVKWWVHCKHCVVGPTPSFDANDFTLIFFTSLWVLTSVPLFLVLGKSRWVTLLAMLALDAVVAFTFMSMNIWA